MFINLKKLIQVIIPNNLYWRFYKFFFIKEQNIIFTKSLSGYQKLFDNYILNQNLKSVFHIGCNTGSYLNYLSKFMINTDFYANDINPNLFQYKNNKNIHFIGGDILKKKFEKYDLIIIHTVLIYLNKKKLKKLLMNIYRSRAKSIIIFDYFFNKYFFDFDTNLYIHSYDELDIFVNNQLYEISELKFDLKTLNEYQKKFIKLYLIKKKI